jgi:hypothetical protein
MELYTLDSLNRRQYVIDQFISLIWTERWQTYGDFELDIYSSFQARSLLKPDTWLAMNKSNYVMRIESVEDDVDDQGNKLLKIKGRDILAILLDRMYIMPPPGPIVANPATVARGMFHIICVEGSIDPGDIIPGIYEGTFMPASTITEPVDPITLNIDPTTLYDAIGTNVLAPWDLGARMLRQESTGTIFFDIYSGSDRTSDQTVLPAVVFAPQLDNLQNTSEITTIDTAKNVAYVRTPGQPLQIVYPADVDPTTNGFERRVLYVDASDITTDNTTDIPSALIQRGLESLAAARTNFLFDGEISQSSQYIYGRDYNLGDMVELQNEDGVQSDMRVTEQIFTEDGNGERSYPTLASFATINTGSWISWNNNKAWADLDSDTTDVWGNQP